MNLIRAAGLSALLLAAACSSKPKYLDRDIVRVVVLPPGTRAVNPDAWKAYWPLVVDWVGSRGYQVIKPEAVERYFQGKYSSVDPDVMRQTAPRQLARAFAADGVFYACITRASFAYLVAASEVRMEADFELVEGKTEEIVWSHRSVAIKQRQVEGKGLDALIGAVAVATAPMEADPAEFWKHVVSEAGRRMPLAGRDPEAAGTAPAPEGPIVKKTAESAPAPALSAPPAPRETLKEPPYVVDSAGWTLAVASRFLLISSMPGKIEEIEGGFVHQNARLAHNQGLVTFARGSGGGLSMRMNELPAEWDGDLVGEYRAKLRSRPELTLKEWLRARLLRCPSRHVQALID